MLDGNYTKQQLYGHFPPITKTIQIRRTRHAGTAIEVRTNTYAIYSCGPLHMDEKRLYDQLESIYNRPLPVQDVARKTFRERWTIETGGERGSMRSVLAARHDDDDDDDIKLKFGNITLSMHTNGFGMK